MIIGPRQVPASSVILSYESVFSGLRASFVKRQAFKPLNRCAPFKPFKQFKYPLPCGC